jgi:SEC-C motif-containing protein
MKKCPCCSDKYFSDCCGPVIQSESANTALALMRSRFTAYVLQKVEYIYNTTHLKTRRKSSLNDIKIWANENKWTKLEIIDSKNGNRNDQNGTVEFKAHFIDGLGGLQIHHEKSNFVKENGKWFYVDGVIDSQKPVLVKTISRNAPCVCGSGKKYKYCCG